MRMCLLPLVLSLYSHVLQDEAAGSSLEGTSCLPHHLFLLSPYQEAYTRVLMGNIDLFRLVFPAATSGRLQNPDWTQSPQALIVWDSDCFPGRLLGHLVTLT